jgi:hypothetical protein
MVGFVSTFKLILKLILRLKINFSLIVKFNMSQYP